MVEKFPVANGKPCVSWLSRNDRVVQSLSKGYDTDSSCIYRHICHYQKTAQNSKKYPVARSKDVTLTPEQQKNFINTIFTKGTKEYSLYKVL